VDADLLKFRPDVGQLTKGGADAVQAVRNFRPFVQHMHLKDYIGQRQASGWLLPDRSVSSERFGNSAHVGGAADQRRGYGRIGQPGRLRPDLTPPHELVSEAVRYLITIGVKFRI
jgi:hypothetical protein